MQIAIGDDIGKCLVDFIITALPINSKNLFTGNPPEMCSWQASTDDRTVECIADLPDCAPSFRDILQFLHGFSCAHKVPLR